MKFSFIFITIVSFLFADNTYAQTHANVLNSAGSSGSTANLSLESNFGETFVGQSADGNSLLLTHGFLQPFGGTTLTVPAIPSIPVNRLSPGLDNAGNSVIVNNIFLESTLGEWMTTTRTGGPFLLTQGILQPGEPVINGPLPVSGLTFQVKRLNAQQVALNWQTLQETNNKGFYIERRKENETSFGTLKFVISKAPNGHSASPLSYTDLDTNYFKGKTYYRLRQEDVDGRFTYSVIRFITGAEEKEIVLKAWPIPAPKEFSVMAEGIDKDVLMLYDLAGRLIWQRNISTSQPVKVTHLKAGTYVIALKGAPDLVQKIVVL